MKKILTLLAVMLFTSFTWSKFVTSPLTFCFHADGSTVSGQTCSGIKYEDGTLLVKNETFRALAVWWEDFNTVSKDYIPFELDADGNPVLVAGAESAFCMWMTTTSFDKIDDGNYPTYAPVGNLPGIAGYSPFPGVFPYSFQFSLNEETVETTIPDEYEETSYRVYFITQDTRLEDGTVSAGPPTHINKWNAVSVVDCAYDQAYIGQSFAMNFENSNYKSIPVPSPTRAPYVEGPAVPEGTSDEVKAAAIAALKDALTDDAYAEVESIYNPDVGAKINGLITGSGCVTVKDGVATFAYAFGVSAISVDGDAITVTVALGTDQTFVEGVAVTLVDTEGAELKGVTVSSTTVGANTNTATVTIQVDPDNIGTLIFKAKAEN